MRASARYLMLVVGSLSVAACGLGTLGQIVEHDAREFDALLLGTWTDSTGKEAAVITGDTARGYYVEYHDEDGKLGEFRAELGRLGGRRVLDMVPVEPEMDASPIYESLLYPMHYPVIIDRLTATELWFSAIEQDSLDALLLREPRAASHYSAGETTVLTAQEPELRRFLDGFLRRPAVTGDIAMWVRKRP